MKAADVPQYIASNHGSSFSLLGDVYTLKITGAQTGGAYALMDVVVQPGNGVPPHVHTREDEAFYILEGELAFTIGGRALTARPGDLLHGPRGVSHCFQNRGATRARMLCLVLPAGFEHFFAELGTPLPGPNAPPVPPASEEMRKVIELAPRYGLQIQV